MKTINALKIGIKNIYESIGCGKDTAEETNMITESNMLNYLGVIEERTNEILQMYDLCKNKLNGKQNTEANEQKDNAKVDLNEGIYHF
jgi:hypothetical protein